MERKAFSDYLKFTPRMLQAIGSGILRLLQERMTAVSMEGNPYSKFIDHDSTDEEAARVQDVILGIQSPLSIPRQPEEEFEGEEWDGA